MKRDKDIEWMSKLAEELAHASRMLASQASAIADLAKIDLLPTATEPLATKVEQIYFCAIDLQNSKVMSLAVSLRTAVETIIQQCNWSSRNEIKT